MTAAGSSLGKGIDCAVSSFPQNSSQTSMVFVFTDGDETDDLMLRSLQKAARFQIPGVGEQAPTSKSADAAGAQAAHVKTKLKIH